MKKQIMIFLLIFIFIDKSCEGNNITMIDESSIINSHQFELENEIVHNEIQLLNFSNNNDDIIKNDNLIKVISTTENQKPNKNYNFDKCYDILKHFYNLSNNETLYPYPNQIKMKVQGMKQKLYLIFITCIIILKK